MSKYQTLDQAILNKIGGAPCKFISIYVRDVADECARLADEENEANSQRSVEPFRIVDRRLQALRKQGVIQASSKGWIRTPARKEQSC